MADLRRNIERSMLVSQVQRVEIMNKIGIDEEEAPRVLRPASHRIHITDGDHSPRDPTRGSTSDRGVNVAQDDAVRASAEELRKRLLAGEPFPRLAGEHLRRRRRRMAV